MSLLTDLEKMDTDLKQVKTDTNSALSEKGSAGVSALSELPLAIRNIPNGGGDFYKTDEFNLFVEQTILEQTAQISFTNLTYPELFSKKEFYISIENPDSLGSEAPLNVRFQNDAGSNIVQFALRCEKGKKFHGIYSCKMLGRWLFTEAYSETSATRANWIPTYGWNSAVKAPPNLRPNINFEKITIIGTDKLPINSVVRIYARG